jgi:hypothetical protein
LPVIDPLAAEGLCDAPLRLLALVDRLERAGVEADVLATLDGLFALLAGFLVVLDGFRALPDACLAAPVVFVARLRVVDADRPEPPLRLLAVLPAVFLRPVCFRELLGVAITFPFPGLIRALPAE